MGRRTVLRVDRPKSTIGEGLRSVNRVCASLSLRWFHHAACSPTCPRFMSFETDSERICITLLPLHCFLFYTASFSTLLPFLHCFLFYTASFSTLLPFLHCFLFYTASFSTLLPFLHC